MVELVLRPARLSLGARALHYSFKALGALAKMVEDESPDSANRRLQASMFLLKMSCYRKPE